MTTPQPVLEDSLLRQFLVSLQELPDVQAKLQALEPVSISSVPRFDAQIDLTIAGKSIALLVEIKKAVYPRDVRAVLWQLKLWELLKSQHPEAYSLIIAESLSPGAKELLRAEGVGYYDAGGSLFLPAPGAYVYVDRPPPKTLAKSMRSLFSGRRAQVLQALLQNPRNWFGVNEVAKLAQVAASTASDVLAALDRFDWMESRGQGPGKERHLREPAALLDEWVRQLVAMHRPTLRRYYVPSLKSEALMERLGQVCDAHQVPYAVSYEAAAQRYAPLLSVISQVRIRMLSNAGAEVALANLDARIVNEGANLAVIETHSPGELLFRQQVAGVWLASPVQVYLDLLQGEGRSKEMADHLRREKIGF